MKKRLITAIDVGTTKVSTIVAEVKGSGEVRVIGVGNGPSKGLHKGLVVNIDEARESIKQSVKKAEQASNLKIDAAYVGVTGRHITSLNNRGVVSITRDDRIVRTDDLKRVLSSAQSMEVPSDRRLLHVIPRNYAVDGQVGVKNPVGMHGFRLDVETHVITAGVTSIQNLVKCIRSIGIDVEDLILEPLASSEAVLTEEEKMTGVMLADIGGGTTDVAIFREGSIWHTSVIPVAGYQLTRDISLGLGLPFDVAEEMKRKYGSVMPVYDGKSGSEPPAISQDGHGVSYQDICDILRARVEEILKLVLLEMPNSDYEATVPAGLVLTGGSSNLSGLSVLAHSALGLPVRVGAPASGIQGLTDALSDPAYSTGVGLLLWGARHESAPAEAGTGFNSTLRQTVTRIKRLFN
ncbi:MAG: cell division protein FtsA [Chloroflexi bacterium]|nr:cell division protein FtsA [Chloroflexota bacterium]